MAVTLDATWGGVNANVYIDLAATETLVSDEFLNTDAWASLENSSDKLKALILATRHIDSYNWQGSKYFYRQALLFPRVPSRSWELTGDMGEPDAAFANIIQRDEYLQKQMTRVKRACAAQALFIITRPRDPERRAQLLGISSRSASRAGVSESESYSRPAHRLCPEALDELRYYRATPRLVRGSGAGHDLYD